MNSFIKKIDKYIEEEEKNMSVNEFEPNDSQSLQEESLISFMEALGYEAVFKFDGKNPEKLVGFRTEKQRWSSASRISVNTAISIHNNDPDFVLNEIGGYINSPGEKFSTWSKVDRNYAMIAVLFAGTCKIIEKVRGNGCKKKGLIITDHLVKFTSKSNRKAYGNFIGL